MKPPPFAYHTPETLEEALALLDRYGSDAKVLAGGQSFVPLLNFRLARPDHVVDINRLAELVGLDQYQGRLRIGALTRQSTLERSPIVARGWLMISEALEHLAHAQIRNRGTVGGSIAHADPAAELPTVFYALDARFELRSSSATRFLSPEECFRSLLTTAIEPEELLVRIEIPPPAPGAGQAFVEYARRHGDFALGGAAALLELDENGICSRASIALLGAGPTPIRARAGEEHLAGKDVDAESAGAAADAAVAHIDPSGDIHGSTEYRRHVIRTVTSRAILLAARRASRDS